MYMVRSLTSYIVRIKVHFGNIRILKKLKKSFYKLICTKLWKITQKSIIFDLKQNKRSVLVDQFAEKRQLVKKQTKEKNKEKVKFTEDFKKSIPIQIYQIIYNYETKFFDMLSKK